MGNHMQCHLDNSQNDAKPFGLMIKSLWAVFGVISPIADTIRQNTKHRSSVLSLGQPHPAQQFTVSGFVKLHALCPK